MKFLIFLLLWFVLLVVSWPLAVLAIVVLPVLWLLSLPFRLLFLVVEAVVALIRSLVFLPARLLGYRRS
jgi:hypothetical protein